MTNALYRLHIYNIKTFIQNYIPVIQDYTKKIAIKFGHMNSIKNIQIKIYHSKCTAPVLMHSIRKKIKYTSPVKYQYLKQQLIIWCSLCQNGSLWKAIDSNGLSLAI